MGLPRGLPHCRSTLLTPLFCPPQAAIRTASKTCAGYLYTADGCASTALEATANFTNAGIKTPTKWIVVPVAGSDAYNIYMVGGPGVAQLSSAVLLPRCSCWLRPTSAPPQLHVLQLVVGKHRK